jgi:hypothetical protein
MLPGPEIFCLRALNLLRLGIKGRRTQLISQFEKNLSRFAANLSRREFLSLNLETASKGNFFLIIISDSYISSLFGKPFAYYVC